MWLYDGYEHCGQPHHRTPREAYQPALTHHLWYSVLLHLPHCMVVQRFDQVEGHTVWVGPCQALWIELYRIRQVIMQVGIGLLDTGEGLTQGDWTQHWQHHRDTQVHHNPKGEETI